MWQKTKYDVLIVQEPEAEPRVLNPWFSILSHTINFRILERVQNLAPYLFRLHRVIVLHESHKMPGPFIRAMLIASFDDVLCMVTISHYITPSLFPQLTARGLAFDSR